MPESKATTIICYKVLNEDGSPYHGGSGYWHLPKEKQPAKWMPTLTNLVPCQHGYHLCAGETQLVRWLGPAIYVAEWRGKRINHDDKIVVASARLVSRCAHWTERTARLFAAACARDVLPIFEKKYPEDRRVRECIDAVEQFARGEIDQIVLQEKHAAACAAYAVCAAYAACAAADAVAYAACAAAEAAACAAADAVACAAAEAARQQIIAKQAARLVHLLATGNVLQEVS